MPRLHATRLRSACRPITRVAGLAALVVAVLHHAALAHPKPGAHADVRITIEPDRVRLDALMNLRFVEGLVNFPRANRDDIAPEEAPPLRAALREYFGAARDTPISGVVDRPNAVLADGLPINPVLAHFSIVRPLPEDRPGFEQNPLLLLPQVHAVVDYPLKGLPAAVSLVWGTYPRDFSTAPDRDLSGTTDISTVLIADGELSLIAFSAAEPEFVWHRPTSAGPPGRDRHAPGPATPLVPAPSPPPRQVPIPIASLALLVFACTLARSARNSADSRRRSLSAAAIVCVAAAIPAWSVARAALPLPSPGPISPSPTDARIIFTALHANIYRAFDYTREPDIYDALARSIDGPLLGAVYTDVYRSLVLQDQGGALSRVRTVSVSSTEVLEAPTTLAPPAFTIRAAWSVDGVVYHWGHSHERTNAYQAEFDLAPRAGAWRIVAHRPLAQHRVETPEQASSAAAANIPRPATSPHPAPWRPNR